MNSADYIHAAPGARAQALMVILLSIILSPRALAAFPVWQVHCIVDIRSCVLPARVPRMGYPLFIIRQRVETFTCTIHAQHGVVAGILAVSCCEEENGH